MTLGKSSDLAVPSAHSCQGSMSPHQYMSIIPCQVHLHLLVLDLRSHCLKWHLPVVVLCTCKSPGRILCFHRAYPFPSSLGFLFLARPPTEESRSTDILTSMLVTAESACEHHRKCVIGHVGQTFQSNDIGNLWEVSERC